MGMKKYFLGSRWGMILTGSIIGLISTVLQRLGNPPGAGLCIVCFERDIAGALGFHRVEGGQYLRPEILGLVLGSTLSALIFKEFKSRGGSAPFVRFVLGVFAMMGAISFMGCPFGTVLRLGSGNPNALIAIFGLIVGVFFGVQFLKAGFDLGQAHKLHFLNGWIMPSFMLILFIIRIFDIRVNDLSAPFLSWVEPSSLFAPPLIAMIASLIIGFIAQRSRFCTIGAFRDIILIRNGHYLMGVISMLVASFLGNLFFGQIKFSLLNHNVDSIVSPIQYVWSGLAATLSGLAFTLMGGCAGRQLFLSGEGDGDASIFVVGMFCGAALIHNFSFIERPACGGVGEFQPLGMVAIVLGLVFCIVIGCTMRHRWEGS